MNDEFVQLTWKMMPSLAKIVKRDGENENYAEWWNDYGEGRERLLHFIEAVAWIIFTCKFAVREGTHEFIDFRQFLLIKIWVLKPLDSLY